MLTISMFSYGQITSFKLISGKEYPNNTRTQYLQLDQTVDKDLHQIIKTELLNNPLITNFSFYDKSDYSMCMYSSDLSIDGDDIIVLINQVLESKTEIDKDANSKLNKNETVYYFYQYKIINNRNVNDQKQIISNLIQNQSIVDAKINNNNILKIKSRQEMSLDEISQILSDFDFFISPTDK